MITAVLVGSLNFNQIAALSTLEITRIVKERTNRLRVMSIGGPHEKAQELRLPADDFNEVVHITRPPSTTDLNIVYKEARVCFLPFFTDTPLDGGSRTNALEYFAHGRLIVSGEEGIGGLPRVGPRTHYFGTTDISSFVDALMCIVEDPDRYEHMRTSAYEYVTYKYTGNALVKPLIGFLM